MTTAEVMKIVRDRGLRIELRPDGRPVIVKPDGSDGVTDALLRVLKWHRERIVESLRSART